MPPAARATAPARPLTPEEWAALFVHVDMEVKKNPDHPLLKGNVFGNPVQTRAPWDPNPDRWEQGVTATGGTRWIEGIQRPRQDFKAAAIASNDAWKAGVAAAVQGDKFVKGMQAVDVDYALKIAATIGPQGYTAGALARKTKFATKTEAIKARMGAVVQRVRGMPNATLAQRVQRVVETINGFAAAAARASCRERV